LTRNGRCASRTMEPVNHRYAPTASARARSSRHGRSVRTPANTRRKAEPCRPVAAGIGIAPERCPPPWPRADQRSAPAIADAWRDGLRISESLPSPRVLSQAFGPDGEIGRRKGLKIPRPQGHPGSSPGPGTSSRNPTRTNLSERSWARRVLHACRPVRCGFTRPINSTLRSRDRSCSFG
jgi:hypothetical protein